MSLGALRTVHEYAELFQIEAASQFGTNHHPADVAVIQVRMQLRKHPDSHPVLGLSIDRAT
ncbi:hypothetical protein D3C85_1941400 [compost metagenome]